MTVDYFTSILKSCTNYYFLNSGHMWQQMSTHLCSEYRHRKSMHWPTWILKQDIFFFHISNKKKIIWFISVSIEDNASSRESGTQEALTRRRLKTSVWFILSNVTSLRSSGKTLGFININQTHTLVRIIMEFSPKGISFSSHNS